MDKFASIQAWWAEQKNTFEFRDAVQDLHSLGGTERDQAVTLHHLIVACYHAKQYAPAKDPHTRQRKELNESHDTSEKLRAAVHLLAKACERTDPGLSWAMAIVEVESGVRLTRLKHDGPEDANEVARRYFSSLAHALDSNLPELDGGPFLHRTCIGNLVFPKPVVSGRQGDVDVVTMLAFELEFRLRLHTAGRVNDNPQLGQTMPTDGKPCRPLVAKWINAALPPGPDRELVDSRGVLDRIRKLPKGTGLMEWNSFDRDPKVECS